MGRGGDADKAEPWERELRALYGHFKRSDPRPAHSVAELGNDVEEDRTALDEEGFPGARRERRELRTMRMRPPTGFEGGVPASGTSFAAGPGSGARPTSTGWRSLRDASRGRQP
jgi:hypothetical protein